MKTYGSTEHSWQKSQQKSIAVHVCREIYQDLSIVKNVGKKL